MQNQKQKKKIYKLIKVFLEINTTILFRKERKFS